MIANNDNDNQQIQSKDLKYRNKRNTPPPKPEVSKLSTEGPLCTLVFVPTTIAITEV